MSLLAPIPLAYRWLALVLAALALLAFGFMKGVQHEEAAQAVLDLAAERATARMASARSAVSSRLDLKYAPALTRIQTITKETIRYVPTFVPADACPLPGGFRVLHDAAAQGLVPDPAGIADAAAVPAQEVGTTVADNYGTCRETATRLEGLQEWVREQLRLNAP